MATAGMTAALLCPGPSLTKAQPKADFIVGVNRATFIAEQRGITCDEWTFGDELPFASVSLRSRPGIFAAQKALITLHDLGHGEQLRTFPRIREWGEVYPRWDAGWGWPDYSATAALICAAEAGAKLIRCYGCDWTNEPDADGVSLATNTRDAERWRLEGEIWQKVVTELGYKGIVVERVLTR